MRYLLVLIMIYVSGCKIFIPTNKNISTNLENESNEALLYTIKIVKPIKVAAKILNTSLMLEPSKN